MTTVDSRRRYLLSVSAAATLVVIAGLWGTSIPLGVPGEWTWERLEPDDWIAPLLTVVPAGILLCGTIVIGARAIESASSSRRACWLFGLASAAGIWHVAVQESGPLHQRLNKAPFVLFYPSSSGYFYKSWYESPNAREFLRNYESLVAEGDVLHVGTHPPGLFLLFHGLAAGQRVWPSLFSQADALRPVAVNEAFAIIQGNQATTTRPLTDAGCSVLWMAMLLELAWIAATVVPLYLASRLWLDRSASWIAASLWPLLPTTAVFYPKSDVLFAGLGLWILAFTVAAVRRRSVPLAAVAATLAWMGLLGSLAFLPILLAAALAAVFDGSQSWSQRWKDRWPVALSALGVFFVWCLAAHWGCGLNLFRIWSWNYHNHAGFYSQFPRSYGRWLVVNPVELFVSVGPPVIVSAVAGVRAAWRRSGESRITASSNWRTWIAISLGTWAILWLSGKNSSEAARLWAPLLPWATMLAASIWDRASSPAAIVEATRSPQARSNTMNANKLNERRPEFAVPWNLACWIALQALACAATVHRVGGFGFGGQR